MKRESIKGFLFGVLLTVLILSSIPALASTGAKTIEIYYNNIKITLDGVQVTPRDGQGNIVEPFTYQGTTYLPVRAVANALGIAVDWDANTKTVILGSGVVSGDWSKDNPAPIGTKIIVDYKLSTNANDSWKGNMFISQVLRGEEAAAEFNKTFFSQNKVGEDQEIVLVKIQIETAPDSPSKWRAGLVQFFTGYSGYNNRLSLATYGTPNDGEGYVWKAFVVDKSDTQPKLAFDPYGVNNAWFRLY